MPRIGQPFGQRLEIKDLSCAAPPASPPGRPASYPAPLGLGFNLDPIHLTVAGPTASPTPVASLASWKPDHSQGHQRYYPLWSSLVGEAFRPPPPPLPAKAALLVSPVACLLACFIVCELSPWIYLPIPLESTFF